MNYERRNIRRIVAVHDLVTRIYADDRFSRFGDGPRVRSLALAMTWVLGVERPAKGEVWNAIYRAADTDSRSIRYIFQADLPRYEPQTDTPWMRQGNTCEAPMIRRTGPCGKRTSLRFRLTNLTDGTWRMAGYCTRHQLAGEQIARENVAAVRAGGIPEPMPNTGGLLPCYATWQGWPDAYKWASYGRWEPPRAGIRNDDWPTMAKVLEKEPPRLVLVDGGGEGSAPGGAPWLEVVK